MNVFDKDFANSIVTRINKLTPESKALWGGMNVAKMLAHCNVSYEMAYEKKHPKPNGFVRFMLKTFVKKAVVGNAPYRKKLRTAPAFEIKTDKDFEQEKSRLIDFINKTVQLGPSEFSGKESLSFGALTVEEWNNLFGKHLEHHLSQFGV